MAIHNVNHEEQGSIPAQRPPEQYEVLDVLPDGVVLVDASRTIQYANPAACRLLQCSAAQLRGTSFLRQFPEHEREYIAARCGAGAHAGWSSVRPNSAGAELAIEYTAAMTKIDGENYTAVTLRDVTETRHLARTAAALARVAASMTYAGSLEATLNALSMSVLQVSKMAGCSVVLRDEAQQLYTAGTAGMPEGYTEALRQAWRTGAVPTILSAIRDGQTLVVRNVPQRLLADPAYAPVHEYFRSADWDVLVCVPLRYRGQEVGTLVGHYQRDAEPDEAEIAFLNTVADQAAVAVVNARMAADAQAAVAREERRQAEEQLQEKEAQYRAVFEATTDGMVISDLNGKHLEVNPAYCAMHGYTEDEMLAMHPSAYIHPDYHGVLAEFFRTIAEGGSFRTRAIDVRKDGTPFHVDVLGIGFTYRGSRHILAVVRDVTEQVEAYRLLEQRVEERTRELSLLLDVSNNMTSTVELQPLLGLVLAQLKDVVDYRDANIMMLDGDELVFISYWGPLEPEQPMIGRRFPIAHAVANREVIEGLKPVIIPDIWEDTPLARSFRQVGERDLDNTHRFLRAWMGVPLIYKERVIGMLAVSHTEPNYYSARHGGLALAIANQAAVAIENARLFAQAQEGAALQERQRLARELHDSVSQALYGIALGTRTARTQLQRDPALAAEPLDYVLSLAEAGLAEMRALIFALRPESLETEGLVAALDHHVAALRARHHVAVHAALGAEPAVPVAVKETVYRVAQEALHNTVKHARATAVTLTLSHSAECLLLEVSDDGVGFDPNGAFPGHLGLRSMQERARGLGGTLIVDSAPGAGTRINVRIPCRATS